MPGMSDPGGTGSTDLARAGPRSPAATTVAAVVVALVVLLAAAYLPLFLLVASVHPRVFGFPGGDCVSALVFAAMGFLIARRYPANPVGWIMLAVAVVAIVLGDAGLYALLVYRVGHANLPLGPVAAWLGTTPWSVALSLLAVGLLLFPDGRLASRGWRAVLWACVVRRCGVRLRFGAVRADDHHGRTGQHRSRRPAECDEQGQRFVGQPVRGRLPGAVSVSAGHPGGRGCRVDRQHTPVTRRAATAAEVVHVRGSTQRHWPRGVRGECVHRGPVDGPRAGRQRPGHPRALRAPDQRRRRGVQVPPLRHRRRHQPHPRVRLAGSPDHRGLRRDRGGDRCPDRQRGQAQPWALHPGDGDRRGGFSADTRPSAARRQPARLRKAGHPIRGAEQVLGPGRRDLRRRRCAATHGQGPVRGHRRGDGDGVAPSRRATAPGGDVSSARGCVARGADQWHATCRSSPAPTPARRCCTRATCSAP